jgi:hypothetical protein
VNAATRFTGLLMLLVTALLLPARANAHAASTSYLDLKIEQAAISGEWDIALRDLEEAIGLDADGDGALTWGEVRGAAPRIEAYALANLQIGDGKAPCQIEVKQLRVADHLDGRYAALMLQGQCSSAPRELHLHYSLLFDLDRLHRGLLKLDYGQQISSDVFAPTRGDIVIEAGGGSIARVFRTYLHEGIWHVWTGWDHLLFLAALFLPAATRRTRAGWQVADALRQPLLESARIVTAFTIAHAATLSIAALGWVHFPTRWVESAVAATVVFAALNNLLPMVNRGLPWLAIFFGLIHGSAIAGALMELGLPTTGRVWALLAFNIGVEIAQLSLVCVVVPLGYALRRSRAYRYGLLLPGSVLVMAIGLLWLVERVFDWRPPFAFF